MKTILLSIAFSLLIFGNAFSQDTLVTRDSKRIVCKIKEVLDNEVKYQTDNSTVVFGISKSDVSKIVLSTGMVMSFDNTANASNTVSTSGQKKNAIKFRVFSPLYGYSDITYERSLRPGNSMECSLGFIGLGSQYDNEVKGGSVRLGYKMIKSPEYYAQGQRYAHILKGAYFRPEIAASYYERKAPDKEAVNVFATALMITVGNQWILNDMVVIDCYFGLGYGYSDEGEFEMQYGYSTGDVKVPLAFTSGLRLGLLFD